MCIYVTFLHFDMCLVYHIYKERGEKREKNHYLFIFCSITPTLQLVRYLEMVGIPLIEMRLEL